MGGNALKQLGIETRRINKEEYNSLVGEIQSHFRQRVYPVLAYKEKQTFGDVDFVAYDDGINWREKIQELGPKAIIHNGPTYSFDYKDFQVDITVHTFEEFSTALAFYDYSPIGNALGKLFRIFGLKYGHRGLSYVIRADLFGGSDTELLADVVICKNIKTIHNLLGLNHNKFRNGFDTQEEIYHWICSSPYFYPQRFSYEEMSHDDRKRDRTRADYRGLLEYIDNNKEKYANYERKDKKEYFEMVCSTFPVLRERLEEVRKQYEEKKELQNKFNGEIVKDLTGLVGKDLGIFIKSFKDRKEDFNSYLRENSKEKIAEDLKFFLTFGGFSDTIKP
jgi:hypothetical protein